VTREEVARIASEIDAELRRRGRMHPVIEMALRECVERVDADCARSLLNAVPWRDEKALVIHPGSVIRVELNNDLWVAEDPRPWIVWIYVPAGYGPPLHSKKLGRFSNRRMAETLAIRWSRQLGVPLRKEYEGNPDLSIRELDRRFRESGTAEDCARVTHARIRGGLIPRRGVVLSFLLGNECARLALELKPTPKIPPNWPWGFAVSNYWIGPWPEAYQVQGFLPDGSINVSAGPGRSGPPIGVMVGELARMGPEYVLAFAARAVQFARTKAILTQHPTPIGSMVDAALEHAAVMAIEQVGDLGPGVHRAATRAARTLNQAADDGDWIETSEEELLRAGASLAEALTSGPSTEMFDHALDAMVHAANVVLIPFWEDIDEASWGGEEWRSPGGGWRLGRQWERADHHLTEEGFFKHLDQTLSPWLLGFEPGPVEVDLS
jgi:hypothetical protein